MSPVQTPNISKPILAAPARTRSTWPLAIVVAVVILGAGSWFLVRPQWQAYQSLPQVEGFEASRQAVVAEIASLKKVTDDYVKLTATDRKRLELALPEGEDLPNLLAQFEGIAKATDFSVSNISFSTVKTEEAGITALDENGVPLGFVVPTGGVKELRLNVTIKGGQYSDLKKFIAAAEQSIRLLKLTSLSFTVSSTGDSEGVNYILTFMTTYLPK